MFGVPVVLFFSAAAFASRILLGAERMLQLVSQIMMARHVLVFFLVSPFLGSLVTAQNGRTECSDDTMRMCRRNIDDVLGGSGNARKLELEDQCWRVRQNLDCVLWQTSMCMKQDDQEANSDIIRKGWRFLESFCEHFKNWWTKPCYRTDRLKRCEESLGGKSRATDFESCRSYLRFRECATLAIERACDSDEQRLLGVYLMDKGQQRAWKCPKDSNKYTNEPINSPLASNTREINSRDFELADSPSFESCLYNTQRSTQECLSKFEDVQKEARDLIDEDVMERKVCCGISSYKDCVFTELKKNCGDDVSRLAKQLTSSLKERTRYNCEKIDEATCSGPMSAIVTHAIIIGGILLSFLATIFV